MRSLVTALLFATSASLAMSSTAAAQSLARPGTWTATPFLHTSSGISDPAPDNSAGLGLAIGYDLTANLGFEGEISHLFDVASDTADIDWSISNFSANAVYHFDVARMTPYATFGLGLERSGYDLKHADPAVSVQDLSSTEVSMNFGGGVKYPLTDRWVARADLRRFQANDIAPDYWRLYGGLTFTVRR
jgi:opacity protein-like surface antigen